MNDEDGMRRELADLRQQVELTRLEQEWARERKRFLIRGTSPGGKRPRKSDGVAVACGGVFFACAGAAVAYLLQVHAGPNAWPAPLVALGIGGVALLTMSMVAVQYWKKAIRYEQSYREYERRKRAIQEQTP